MTSEETEELASLLVPEIEPNTAISEAAGNAHAEATGQANAEAAPTTVAESESRQVAANADEKPAQPGTPDKALQKLQQDNAAAIRRIEALEGKSEPLTAKEQQQLDQAKSKLAEIRERLAGDFDVLDHGKDVAEATIELGSEVENLKKELAEIKATTQAQRGETVWKQLETQFEGVNVRDIWNKAVSDATDTLGDAATPAAVNKLASRWLDERAKAVQASLKSKPAPSKKAASVVPVAATATKAAATSAVDDDEDLSYLIAKDDK